MVRLAFQVASYLAKLHMFLFTSLHLNNRCTINDCHFHFQLCICFVICNKFAANLWTAFNFIHIGKFIALNSMKMDKLLGIFIVYEQNGVVWKNLKWWKIRNSNKNQIIRSLKHIRHTFSSRINYELHCKWCLDGTTLLE